MQRFLIVDMIGVMRINWKFVLLVVVPFSAIAGWTLVSEDFPGPPSLRNAVPIALGGLGAMIGLRLAQAK